MAKSNSGHMFVVDFDYFTNFELSRAAVKIFDARVQRYIWVLHQNGSLLSLRSSLKKVAYFIDFDDPETIRCFNQIPLIHANKASIDVCRSWRLKIFENHIPGWRDTLCMDDDKQLYIKEFRLAWEKTEKYSSMLASDVENIRRRLA